MNSNLTPAFLDDATADEIAALSPAELASLREMIGADLAVPLNRQAKLEQGITVRYGERAHAALAPKGMTGTVHLDDDGYDIEVTAPKKVHWDQDKIRDILNAMDESTAEHYAKVIISVEERKYQAAPPAIQATLRDARTVVPGKWKITFARKMAEVA